MANVYRENLRRELGIDKAEQRQARCAKIGGPKIGMGTQEVLASCFGKPEHVAQSVTAEGKHEVWSYPEGYVYLSDGVVTKIVTAR